jgi:hypothetical protein
MAFLRSVLIPGPETSRKGIREPHNVAEAAERSERCFAAQHPSSAACSRNVGWSALLRRHHVKLPRLAYLSATRAAAAASFWSLPHGGPADLPSVARCASRRASQSIFVASSNADLSGASSLPDYRHARRQRAHREIARLPPYALARVRQIEPFRRVVRRPRAVRQELDLRAFNELRFMHVAGYGNPVRAFNPNATRITKSPHRVAGSSSAGGVARCPRRPSWRSPRPTPGTAAERGPGWQVLNMLGPSLPAQPGSRRRAEPLTH